MTDGPEALVTDAATLLRPSAGTTGPLSAGTRARVAAALLRLALEQALDRFWQSTAPAMTRTVKHRILCLEGYTDRVTARRWYLTWSALSGACHYRAHVLPPSPTEIDGRLREVAALLETLRQPRTAAPGAGLVPSPGRRAGRSAVPPARDARTARPVPKPGPPPA